MRVITVLVVDDEPLICQNVCSKISRLQHSVKYVTVVSQDMDSALGKFREVTPDIVITDICMPGGSGLTLAEKLRKQSPELTIFVLSGFDDFSYVRQAFLLGVNDYLLKPLSLSELDEKLRLHLGSGKAGPAQGKQATIIDKAKQYIDKNQERQVSLSETADFLNISYHYFSKLFKDTEGISFSNYVAKRKMRLAAELLADPAVRITEVAKKLGFENPNHFSRAFKNIYGKYPTQYRKDIEKDETVPNED